MGYYEARIEAQKEITKIIKETSDKKPLSRSDISFYIRGKYPVPSKMPDSWIDELMERGFIIESNGGLIWKQKDSESVNLTKKKPEISSKKTKTNTKA